MEFKIDMDKIIARLKEADVVPVVRCKECKHHIDERPGAVFCPEIIGGWVGEDFFCAYCDRRKDGEEA